MSALDSWRLRVRVWSLNGVSGHHGARHGKGSCEDGLGLCHESTAPAHGVEPDKAMNCCVWQFRSEASEYSRRSQAEANPLLARAVRHPGDARGNGDALREGLASIR
jgi:hypothetical protein